MTTHAIPVIKLWERLVVSLQQTCSTAKWSDFARSFSSAPENEMGVEV